MFPKCFPESHQGQVTSTWESHGGAVLSRGAGEATPHTLGCSSHSCAFMEISPV